MREDFDLNTLIYSFYNSLTLMFTEIDGRFYGGGVLELTPMEYKRLPITYYRIDKSDFRNFQLRFENKASIAEILVSNDEVILKQHLGLSKNEVSSIREIRRKLVERRIFRN